MSPLRWPWSARGQGWCLPKALMSRADFAAPSNCESMSLVSCRWGRWSCSCSRCFVNLFVPMSTGDLHRAWWCARCHAGMVVMDLGCAIPGDARVPLPCPALAAGSWRVSPCRGAPRIPSTQGESGPCKGGSQKPAQSWQIPPGPSEGKAWTPECFSLPLQTTGYAAPTPFQPLSPNISSPPRSLAMHFGPMSPSLDPTVFFSPSASGQLNLR